MRWFGGCLFGCLVVVTIGFVASELFVGRGGEVGLLHEVLAGVKAGVGGVVLVVGEQGVGKSSLLRAGLGEAEDQGCRLLWGVSGHAVCTWSGHVACSRVGMAW